MTGDILNTTRRGHTSPVSVPVWVSQKETGDMSQRKLNTLLFLNNAAVSMLTVLVLAVIR